MQNNTYYSARSRWTKQQHINCCCCHSYIYINFVRSISSLSYNSISLLKYCSLYSLENVFPFVYEYKRKFPQEIMKLQSKCRKKRARSKLTWMDGIQFIMVQKRLTRGRLGRIIGYWRSSQFYILTYSVAQQPLKSFHRPLYLIQFQLHLFYTRGRVMGNKPIAS